MRICVRGPRRRVGCRRDACWGDAARPRAGAADPHRLPGRRGRLAPRRPARQLRRRAVVRIHQELRPDRRRRQGHDRLRHACVGGDPRRVRQWLQPERGPPRHGDGADRRQVTRLHPRPDPARTCPGAREPRSADPRAGLQGQTPAHPVG